MGHVRRATGDGGDGGDGAAAADAAGEDAGRADGVDQMGHIRCATGDGGDGAAAADAAADAAGEDAGRTAGGSSEGRILTYVPADAVDSWEAGGHPEPIPWPQVSEAVSSTADKATAGNVTWFHPIERANPIHFWEQRLRCFYCGRDHFVTAQHPTHDHVASMSK
jgi:hypothetical protein